MDGGSLKCCLFMTNRNNFVRFLSYVSPYKYFVALAAVGGIVKFTVPLLVPQLIRHLVDDVFLSETLSAQAQINQLLLYVAGLIALFIFIWAPATFFRSYFAGKAGYRSVFDLRIELFYRILRMSASFFTRNRSGGIVSRLISDIELVQNLVGTALTNIWMDFAALVVVLYFLIRIDPVLTMVAVVTFPLYVVLFRKFKREIKASTHRVQEELATMSGNVQEKIAGSAVVHAFTQEKREEENFYDDSERLFSTAMRRIRYQAANMSVTGALTQIAPLIVILYGGLRVINGGLTVGELVAVGLYLGPLYVPLQRFSELNVVLSNALAALDRVFEIIDEQPEIRDRPGSKPLQDVRGHVEFDQLTFSYNNDEDPVLQNVSFNVEPGKKVALVGPSGSGKSTLVSLIPRFYDVRKGFVRIDGQDVRSVTMQSLRQNIGLVLQTPILFSGTIRENILYGRPRASNRDVISACEAANSLDFIRALPKGFETEVGEGGALLSGGQRQRITIARAFLKDPKILILDEATSSLDTESERLIQAALEKLMIGRTTFIIAHRLTTIQGANQILVLEHGRVVDSGTHAQLLGRTGVYQNLYSHAIN